MARQSHAFFARSFRDFVRDSIDRHPTVINRDDGAIVKLGLGWRVRDRAKGAEIHGKGECTAFLNDVVRLLEDELCELLHQFNRESTILLALSNHESAIGERDNWARTAAAVLSLHDNKDATLQAMAEQDFKLNAVFQATRMLIEFAICECPIMAGREVGDWDLSRLMTLIMMIFEFGGWSDTIRWDASEPFIRITPLGDIHGSFRFHDEVLAPYSRAASDLRVSDHIEAYAKNLEEAKAHPTDLSVAPPEFWDALEEEFGASADDIRKFTEFVERLGLEANKALLKLRRSALLRATFEGAPINPTATVALVKYLTFESRPRWRDVPEGYLEKDRHPWRFRRRLSVLRKPLIQIDDAEDPTIIVAPGLLRDAIAYAVNNLYHGDFPLSQLQPKLKRWAGKSRDRIGREFTLSVAKRLDELGWETETEVKITKLLQRRFEKNYGDVDVLAWNTATGRVLIIECKDLQYRKTEGKIAEQLADFRGETGADGKPDLLLRHVDRYELIARHLPELAKYIMINCAPQVESHLVFKNPVPMQYAWERMKECATLHIFAGLAKI